MKHAEATTVMMPVKNGGVWLETLLRRMGRILDDCDRIFVVDDGSADASYAIAHAFEELDQRFEVWRFEESKGIAGALNFMLERVETPLVSRMDCDDVCLPWRFALHQSAHARGVDVSFVNHFYFEGSGLLRIHPRPLVHWAEEGMRLGLLCGNFLAHSGVSMRTDVLTGMGGYRHVAAEDYDLWLRMVDEGFAVECSSIPGLLVRRHAKSTQASGEWNRWFSTPDALLVSAYLRLWSMCGGSELTPKVAGRAIGGAPSACYLSRLQNMIGSSEEISAAQRAILNRRVRSASKRSTGLDRDAGAL